MFSLHITGSIVSVPQKNDNIYEQSIVARNFWIFSHQSQFG